MFVTPFVMDEAVEDISEKARNEIDGSRRRLDELTSQLEATRRELEEKAPKKK